MAEAYWRCIFSLSFRKTSSRYVRTFVKNTVQRSKTSTMSAHSKVYFYELSKRWTE